MVKVFGGELYRGFIIDIDQYVGGGGILYCIEYMYEDCDEEDMNVDECVQTIKLYKRIENGEIDEWKIGEE